MECPICFAEFDSTERVPLKAFCKCGKTLCLVCIESMIQNNAVCPWDKTRWSGRNLMSKFYNNTPDNYLITLQTRISDDESVVAAQNVCELGSGELRSDYLHQLQRQSQQFHAEREDQLRKDTLMALALQKEANDKLLQLQQTELEDQKLARLLAQQSNSQVKSVKKNTIMFSLQRQKSIADVASINSACSSSSGSTCSQHRSPDHISASSAAGVTDTELSPLSVAAGNHFNDSQESRESEEDGARLSPVLIRRRRHDAQPLSNSGSSSYGKSTRHIFTAGGSNAASKSSFESTDLSAPPASTLTATKPSLAVRVTAGSVLAARDRVNSALGVPCLEHSKDNDKVSISNSAGSGNSGSSCNSCNSCNSGSNSDSLGSGIAAGKSLLPEDWLSGTESAPVNSRSDVAPLFSRGIAPTTSDFGKHKVLGKRPVCLSEGEGSGPTGRILSATAASGDWHCAACTFLNNRFLTQCEVCDAIR